jgi:hypothetical protein
VAPDRAGRTIAQRLQALGINTTDLDAAVHAALDRIDEAQRLLDLGAAVLDHTHIQVSQWTRRGAAAPEQVHMVVRNAGLVLAVRMESGATCDALIAALTRQRVAVFGPQLTLVPGGGQDV